MTHPSASLSSCDLPPPPESQFPVQDLDFDSFRLDGQPNGLTGFEGVFGDLDNDPVALQHLLNSYNETPSDIQDSGSADFFDTFAGPVFGPAENQLSKIELAPLQSPIQTTCANTENLLLPSTEIEYDLVQHLFTNIEIPLLPTTETEHVPFQHPIEHTCAYSEPLHPTIQSEGDPVNQLIQTDWANIEGWLLPTVNIELPPPAQYHNQTTYVHNESLLPTIETEHDPVQFHIQTASVTAQDPSDFFFKSFPHTKNDLKRMSTTAPRISTAKKRKISEEKVSNLTSKKDESNRVNKDTLENVQGSGGMKLMSELPKALVADARNLGIRSVAPLFRETTEAAEKSTRKPVARQLLSMQISAEWYLQIQAAAKEYMLDVRYPKRMAAVGLKTRAGADSTDLFNCCMEFLEQEWGENCWGIMADVHKGRTLLWPQNKSEITNRVMPLLRRVVTNERQRIYAAEKRKERKDGSFDQCSQATKSHSNTPNTPNSPFIPFVPNIPISSNTSPGQLSPEGYQTRKLRDSEIRPRILKSPSPFPDDTNQDRYNSGPERDLDTSRRTSTSSETSGNESDSSLATRTDMSSSTEASMIHPIKVTKPYVKPIIKLHVNFLQCGHQVKDMAIMNVTLHTTFSCFIQNIRSMIAGDLMMLKKIQVLSSERSFDVNNPEAWNKALVEVMERVWMNSEAKVMVEVEEDLFGEEREVSPFVTLL